MKRLLRVTAIVVGATVLAGTSLARDQAREPESIPQETIEPRSPRFERLDVDGNAELSRDELFMIAPARFDQLDDDEDGVLSPAEFRELDDERDPRARFRRLDSDGDGRIRQDELPEGMRARFKNFDANDDGFVDEDEVKRMALSMREARNGPTALMRRLMELDLDEDGRLHLDELPEAMEYLRRQFDELDINSDGYIDGAELRAMTEESRRLQWRYE